VIVFYKSDTPKVIVKQTYANEASRFMSIMGMELHYRDEGNQNEVLNTVTQINRMRQLRQEIRLIADNSWRKNNERSV